MSEGRAAFRIKVLAGLVVLMFAALTTRLWFLQVLASEKYRTEASQNSIRFVEDPAPRGEILDRNGDVLVENTTTYQVTINRQKLGKRKDQILQELAKLTGTPTVTLERLLEDKRYYPFTPVPVVANVDKNVAAAIYEHTAEFPPGVVRVQQVPVRKYPLGVAGAHVLGHTGILTEELAGDPKYAGYDPNDTVGIDGVESTYESDLRGIKGKEKLRINAAGEVLSEIGHEAPIPGNDVVLTLDAGIQEAAEQELENGIKRANDSGIPATSGAAIVVDPKTGGVVAMASSPTFDPRIYEDGLSFAENAEILKGQRKNPPLLNRATSGEYAPGSTFKPFIGLVALKEKLASQNSHFDCAGQLKVGSTVFHNWDPTDQGGMTIAGALPPSCDTVFYHLAADLFWPKFYKDGYLSESAVSGPTLNESLHGPELLQRGLHAFGFGEYTGIDLPTGAEGLIPDEQWKFDTWYPQVPHKEGLLNVCDFNICTGDLVNMAIGQGDVKVTPLQLTMAYSAIAEDGLLCRPHLGLRVQDPTGKTVRQIPDDCHQMKGYSASDFRYIRQGLAGVVSGSGTAAPVFAGFPWGDIQVAGKTGSSEVANQGELTNSWFAAMTKGQDKKGDTHEYVVVVMVERGGHGAETAAPIARQIIERAYGFDGSGLRVIQTDAD